MDMCDVSSRKARKGQPSHFTDMELTEIHRGHMNSPVSGRTNSMFFPLCDINTSLLNKSIFNEVKYI